ncbi:hypothetical protein [Acaryochloris marina]|nr:hypothetical protein [Acaryochloris marina]
MLILDGMGAIANNNTQIRTPYSLAMPLALFPTLTCNTHSLDD